MSNTYSEYVFISLGIQRTMHMRRVMLSSVAYPAVQYFFTSQQRHDLIIIIIIIIIIIMKREHVC